MTDLSELFKKISKKETSTVNEPVSWLIVGLGNPGEKYARTRHNAGFLALDYFAQKNNIKINKSKFKALVAKDSLGGKGVLYMMPQTFMNNSGEAVREAADFYKIAPENVIVIYDDISLEPGKLRVRRKGSAGGHNGIKSIIYHLGSDNFPRIKLGVGSPAGDLIDWVLGDIPKADREEFYSCLEKCPDICELIVSGKIDRAMNLYN